MKKLPAWTASSIDAFTTCPHKYYRLRIAKDTKDLPMSEQTLYGQKVHKMFEDAINWGDPLPDAYKKYVPLVEKIKAIPGTKLPEFRFSITGDFRQCKWGEAWSRGAADLVIKHGNQCIILDYKTGKRKPLEQLALYAGFAFAYWPEIEVVHTAYVWLRDMKIDKKTFYAKDKHEIWQNWLPLVARLERCYDRDDWPKHPSGLCKNWCPVKDCEFCGV